MAPMRGTRLAREAGEGGGGRRPAHLHYCVWYSQCLYHILHVK